MWKEQARQLRQHWFITKYIAAYIQGLYKGARVHTTGLAVNQGCRPVSRGLPPSSGLGWKEKRSEAVPFDVTGTASVETVKVPLGVHCHAGLEAADGDDLVSGPDWDGEGAGPRRSTV